MCEQSVLYKATYKAPGKPLERRTSKDLSIVMDAPVGSELLSMYRWDHKKGWVEVYRLAFCVVPNVVTVSQLGRLI